MASLTQIEEGFLLGVLAGEGHFGGDGRQAQVTLRMHVRHERLFAWLADRIPGSKTYGPYHHGGRHYYQWMVRGQSLREELLPVVLRNLSLLDDYVQERVTDMVRDYRLTNPPA